MNTLLDLPLVPPPLPKQCNMPVIKMKQLKIKLNAAYMITEQKI